MHKEREWPEVGAGAEAGKIVGLMGWEGSRSSFFLR